MERFAAEAIKTQRDQAIRAALKANVPWPDLMEDYGLSLAEIMEIDERTRKVPEKADLRDPRDEPKVLARLYPEGR